MRNESGKVIGRLDVEGFQYEVLVWIPGDDQTTQGVRDHFATLLEGSADGNIALFIAWITQNKPVGTYATIPSGDYLLWGYSMRQRLCTATFVHGGFPEVYRELYLDVVDEIWGEPWQFVAFRQLGKH